MKRLLPPGQLTTSELAREIAALEGSADDQTQDAEHEGGRLGALYEELGQRKRLAEHHFRAARQQFPDDAS
jgi:hypothetical protein